MKNKFFATTAAVLSIILMIFGLFYAARDAYPVYEDSDLPKIMLFVKDSELTGDMKRNVRKLEKEFGKEIDIEVNNVDENKDLLKSYPVDGNTPAVIAADESGDVTGIYFCVTEYEKLYQIAENIKNGV